MAGIYVHIPFCRTACTYCDFHFSTRLQGIKPLLAALISEIEATPESFRNRPIRTLYWGGGTPSILTAAQMLELRSAMHRVFDLSNLQEFTLEVNPEDVNAAHVDAWMELGVNRVSMGVQSFQESFLRWMNRPHRSDDIHRAFEHLAESTIKNWNADLIFAIPGQSLDDLHADLHAFTSYPIRHISAYGLTLEPRTAYAHQVKTGLMREPDEETFRQHYAAVMDHLDAHGFEAYELSNYALPGARSLHNSSYWEGEEYFGFGPGAHQFIEGVRGQNVANNAQYIRSIKDGKSPFEPEPYRRVDRLNDYILTQIRRIEGISLDRLDFDYGTEVRQTLQRAAQPLLEKELIWFRNGAIGLTREGKFVADSVALALFFDTDYTF